jgi:hypothetical protein
MTDYFVVVGATINTDGGGGATKFMPGERATGLTPDDVGRFQAAGGVLWSTQDPDMARAAAVANRARNRAQNETELTNIMLGGTVQTRARQSLIQAGITQSITVSSKFGDDRSSGYPNSPIQSNDELNRRTRNVPITANLAINHLDYPPNFTDPLRLDLNLQQTRSGGSPVGGPVVIFQAPPLLLKRTVQPIAASTPRVRSTNTPNSFSQAALDATDLTMRVRVPTGPRAGARCWLAKSLGGGAYRVSEPAIFDPDPFTGQIQTPVVLAAADPFVVEQASGAMCVDYIRVRGGNAAYGNQAVVFFNDYDFNQWLPTGGATLVDTDGCVLLPVNCRFTGQFPDGSINGASSWMFRNAISEFTSWVTLENCCGFNGFLALGGNNQPNDGVDVGLYTELGVTQGEYASFYNDVLLQDPIVGGSLTAGLFSDGTALVDAVGVMDARYSGGGIFAREDGRVLFTTLFYGLGGYAWGTSATGGVVGVEIDDDGSVRYRNANKLSITGAGGDIRMGNRLVGEPFDLATRTFLASINLTWPNIQNSAVSKDNVHDFTRRCSIRKSTGLRY